MSLSLFHSIADEARQSRCQAGLGPRQRLCPGGCGHHTPFPREAPERACVNDLPESSHLLFACCVCGWLAHIPHHSPIPSPSDLRINIATGNQKHSTLWSELRIAYPATSCSAIHSLISIHILHTRVRATVGSDQSELPHVGEHVGRMWEYLYLIIMELLRSYSENYICRSSVNVTITN